MSEPPCTEEQLNTLLAEMGHIPQPPPPASTTSTPSTTSTDPRPPSTNLPNTWEDLALALRACPAEVLPATVESATAPEPEPDSIRNPKSEIRNSTPLGTPRARSWDDAWLAAVDAAEARLGRRICGARLIDNTPCEIASDHANGRCRFHGGFDLTGAPPGNRNAYLHELYSRRLKTCGDHCPQWSTCPMVQQGAGPAAVDQIPLHNRPVCPYEQAEYNTALADALDLSSKPDHISPFSYHVAHNIAILQVMLGRAAVDMRNAGIAAQTHAQSDKYTFNHEQLRPHITAISRIGGELRKWLAVIAQNAPRDLDWEHYQNRCRAMRDSAPGPEPEQFQYVPPDQSQARADHQRKLNQAARNALTRAVLLANEERYQEAVDEWSRASETDPAFTDNWTAALRKTIKTKQRAAARIKPPP